MPAKVEYPEAGIFHAKWLDPLTMDDIGQQSEYILDYANQHGVEQFVIISDLSECSHIPMEVQKMRQYAMSDRRILGYVIVRTQLLAKVMIRMLDKLTPQEYRTAETVDDALTQAREILGQALTTGQ